MNNKIKVTVFIIIACLFATIMNAQFAKSEADNLVLDSIIANDIGKVDVFSAINTKSGIIQLIDNDSINCAYANNYVYFIDDMPFSGWGHSCRYIFVNSQTGEYTIVTDDIYPKNLESDFQLLSEAIHPVAASFTANISTNTMQENEHLKAVIVCVYDNQKNWNDVSLIFNTLIQHYGYTKDNIIVHYGKYGSSTTYYGDDLDGGSTSNDLDYSAFSTAIHATFNELAGNTNNNANIEALDEDDQLSVFITDTHVFFPIPEINIWGFWADDGGGAYIDIESPTELADIIDDINCAQILMTFSINSAKGIADYFVDTNKNRYLHTASDIQELKQYEQYISGGNYSEYFFYWAASVRGVYPNISQPWLESEYTVGNFPFSTIPGLGDHPGDIYPDTDGDGYVQMGEAFAYANKMDTWSNDGYYYKPYTSGIEESPQYMESIAFSEDLLTLSGIAGHVTTTQTVESRDYLIGGDLIIDNGINLTLANGGAYYLGNEMANIKVQYGANLIVQNNASFSGNTPNKIIVGGNIQFGNNVTFNRLGSSGYFAGLDINNQNANTTINQATFTNTHMHNYGNNLIVNDCYFDDCIIIYSHRGTVTYSNSDFIRTWLYIENTDENSYTATVSNCNFTTNVTMAAIDIWNYDNFYIQNNTISGFYNGIQLSQSGGGLSANQSIFNNEIYNCTMSGIHAFNSTATLGSNYIHDNKYGIRLYDYSNIALAGNVNAQDYSEMNYITDNSSYEIYTSAGSFPWYFRFNAIIDEDNVGNPTDPMVYAELPGSSLLFDVKYNCWTENNNFSPSADLYPSNYLVYPTYCPPSGGHKSTELALEDFQEGLEQFENEEYEDAKTTFESVIDSYAETQYSSASMKELLELEKFLESDYSALQTYYETNDSIQADSVLSKLAIFLANKCEIEMENWQNAIDHFEYVIENPDTPEDSIFAIIDLGYTYFLMENSESRSTALGRLIEHKPDNFEAFAEKRDYLLSLLPFKKSNDKPEIEIESQAQNKVFQNVPNPFTNSTNVHFNLTVSSGVIFNIYDNMGKLVKVIDAETKPKGQHKVEIDMKGFPKGIYFYSMYVNGQLADSKKMIVNSSFALSTKQLI